MNNCMHKKQKIKKCLTIKLDWKIKRRQELNSIIKIIVSGLFVESLKLLYRYPASTAIEVKSDKYKAIINIKGDFIIVAGNYNEFNVEIHKRLIEILEVEND